MLDAQEEGVESMRKQARETGSGDKRLRLALSKVESTANLIRAEAKQMGNLAEVLDHWGGLIRVTRVMGQAVIDSEQWVREIQTAIQAMTKRTVHAAKKLRAIITAHEKNYKNGT
jgi:hypothetical protein